MTPLNLDSLCGVWSAAPTPFDDNMEIDGDSVHRLAEHHLKLGITGVFIAGTCGEGPWMLPRQRRVLVRETVAAMHGRMPVAVQVTDNSTARILENIQLAEADGADAVVIAPPYVHRNPTPDTLRQHYLDAVSASTLPVIIYDLGRHAAVWIPNEVLPSLYEAENVVAIKDSSGDASRRDIALGARAKRPDLRLFDGDEFRCDEYLAAGYDGVMLGGAAFNGFLAGLIIKAVLDGDIASAQELQQRMNRIMHAVYGGENIECWLAGEKEFLVRIGVFKTHKNYLNYQLSESCRLALENVLSDEAEYLFPSPKT